MSSSPIPWNEFDDRWNPIFVREVRRTLKSRMFLGTFLLLLLTCWVSCLVLVSNHAGTGFLIEAGRSFCMTYLMILQVPICFIVPIHIFSVSSEERIGNTFEMIAITSLNPKKILRGFMNCGLFQAGMYYSAILPFICFGYLFEGVSIAQIIPSLMVSLFFGWISWTWGILMGASVRGSTSRAVCFFFNILGGLALYWISSGFFGAILFSSSETFWIEGFLPGMFCCGLPLFIVMFIFLDVANQRFHLTNLNKRPYQVILDKDGNVIRFKADPTGLYQEVPEWHQRINASSRENTEKPEA